MTGFDVARHRGQALDHTAAFKTIRSFAPDVGKRVNDAASGAEMSEGWIAVVLIAARGQNVGKVE